MKSEDFCEQLPRSCIPVPKIEEDGYDWYSRHQRCVDAAHSQAYDVVMIGDSITHYWQGEPENGAAHGTQVWEEFFAGKQVLNLGYGFDRTQNVLWRLEHGELDSRHPPKVIVLAIGTNQFSISTRYSGDSPATASQGILAVVAKIHTIVPTSKLIVMSIFPRGPKDSYFRTVIPETNDLVKKALASLPDVTLIDLAGQFLQPDGELTPGFYQPDNCHLAPNGYRAWCKAIRKSLDFR